MNITVKPSKACGTVAAPPSKSMAHRLLICAAMAKGTSHITNIAYSEDILATIDCIRALGAEVTTGESDVTVKGTDISKRDAAKLMCRESGSTIRFFIGLSMLSEKKAEFFGSETLLSRPFSVYEEICDKQNIRFDRKGDYIELEGKIKPGVFKVPGNVSSQFITGLLFVLPLLDKDSRIEFTTEVESKSYLDLTLDALKSFDVVARFDSEGNLEIPGCQEYKARDIATEGDYSNAAFLDIFNYIGGNVNVTGLLEESLQGDRVYGKYFDALKAGKATLDISDCPDLGPVLFIAAACNHGGIFTGTKRLKIKESDRGTVMCEELSKFGIKSRQEEDTIEIIAGELHAPSEYVLGHNDHRIVMSFATLLSITGGSLLGAQAVRKSFPDYFDKISSLGIEVIKDGMDQQK